MKRFSFLMLLLAAVGFVSCEDNGDTTVTESITISVDKSEIVNDGVSAATFTVVKQDAASGSVDVTAECRFYNAETGDPLNGNKFAATELGEYSFYAMYGAVKSDNTVVVTVKQAAAPDEKPVAELKASKSSIMADGVDEVVFSVFVDGEDVTSVATIAFVDGGKIKGNTFTTTAAGVYAFYAYTDNSQPSSVVEVVAEAVVEEEKPIVLTATKTEIEANGVDAIVFTVSQDGVDVTSECTLYANGSPVNGNRFATYEAGSYTVYGKKGSLTSNEIVVTATPAVDRGKTVVFAEGVTLNSGWYDVNKVGQGDNGDINMCWAAASSNMIQWFQDRYVAAGKTLPSTAITGPGRDGTYELALMDMFHSEWDNSKGGHMEEAIPWYFEGKLNGGEFASPGSQAVPLTEGGYWKSIWDTEVYPNIYHEYENVIVPGVEGLDLKNLYITIFNNYYHWGDGTPYQGTERLAEFSKLVVEIFRHGMAGLTISLAANLSSAHHATTLWGYEIDNTTGLLTRIWITDSDDMIREPKDQLLNEYNVSIDAGKSHIKLTGNTRYGACYIVSLHPFAGYGVGE